MIPQSVLRSIMELRTQVNNLEAERVALQDEIQQLNKKIKYNQKQLKIQSPIIGVTDVMAKINYTIENNLNDIRRAKIHKKLLNRELNTIKKQLSEDQTFEKIDPNEILTSENLAKQYYILLKEMFAAPPFPDENLIYRANWRVANSKPHDVDTQFRDIIENLHKFAEPFESLDIEQKRFIVKQAGFAKKAMNMIIKDFIQLDKQESLNIDVPHVTYEKVQCANDFAYLKYAIDRIFR
ncbi:hypothetical protein TVAG_364380 [Trichomonas vaginalis G3]|uniref:Uncharacterized protein n=1 Tax=Trichomonas vaginalis (strain ATCC PRA-98 / G3) TaxID=412133 RepID=A2E9E9_TRIV3|nr:hypothetical protein TVAGG3_0000900 [Trichomonas vaginalis G3]EAY10713.1 hypothetical protein TVAG_364380 [Trichomonas vaginalis G3]KAI5538606.1 hypothetical protein TVAGG3_0000900 [Trichomonas vaginalis G3]|eukprot:XP_001322936.1 hypothetical protein [Trichomonas vaginalis G3]